MNQQHKLSILYWNARSLLKKSIEFFNFILDHSIDVALINETWLCEDNRFYNPNFICYRSDRVSGYGGVAIVIRKGIIHQQLPHINTEIIESIGVRIKTDKSYVNLIAIYFPGSKSKQIMTKFRSDIQLLTSLKEDYFLCGDFNSRHRSWDCLKANAAGNVLYSEMQKKSFVILHPPTNTYCPISSKKSPSTLDIVVTNSALQVSQLSTTVALSSDHLPVTFDIFHSISNNSPANIIYNYNNADWWLYRHHIHNNIRTGDINIGNILDNSNIDEMVDYITNLMHEAKNLAIPKVSPHQFYYTLTNDIRQLIYVRNFIRRKWQRTRDTALKSIVNSLTRQVSAAVNELRNNSWNKLLNSFNKTDNKFWKITKLIKNKSQHIPTLHHNNVKLLTAHEKCNVIADNFSNSQNITDSLSDPVTISTVNAAISALNNCERLSATAQYTKPKEIASLIKCLKNSKSPGSDKLNNKLLKNLPRKALIYLTILFNGCFKLSYFPDQWKKAVVIPIAKPNKIKSSPLSYRPISLLSCLGKLFEKVILKRLIKQAGALQIVPNEQFGFRPGYSTSHQLARIVSLIKSNFYQKNSVGMLSMDIEKAFDSVWHNALIYKLLKYDFPTSLVRLIQSYLKNRSFYVKILNETSNTHDILAGVPQGAVLSPFLYNIFIADFPKIQNTHVAFYADDTAILVPGLDPNEVCVKMQNAFDKLTKFYTKWKIQINTNKTQCVYFTRRRALRYLPQQNLLLNGQEVPWDNTLKYLGLYLDKKLTFKCHIECAINKTEKIIRILYPLINRKSQMNIRNKLIIYKAILRPVLTYACPIFANCASTHLRQMQIFQNRCLKIISNLPKWHNTDDLHYQTNVNMIVDFINTRRMKFNNSLMLINNPLISASSLNNF